MGKHVAPLRHIIPDSKPAKSFFFLLTAACLAEKQQIPIVLVFGWPEATIYCTQGDHTNHYTTDAVLKSRRTQRASNQMQSVSLPI